MGTGTRGNSLPLAARGIWEGIEGVAVLFCTRLATMLPYYTCRTVLLVTPHHTLRSLHSGRERKRRTNVRVLYSKIPVLYTVLVSDPSYPLALTRLYPL